MTQENGRQSNHSAFTQSVAELFASGQDAHKAGHLQKAATLYRKVLDQEPNHANAWHGLGLCYYQTRAFKDATSCLEKAVEYSPLNSIMLNSLGATLCAAGLYEKAEPHLQKAIELQENNVEALRNIGSIRFAQEKYTDAISYFQTALSHAPNHTELLKATGNAFLHLGQPDEALVFCEKALSIAARDADLQTNTGLALQMQKRYTAALEFNSLAICIAPGDNRHWAVFCACIHGLYPTEEMDVEDKLIALINAGDQPPHELIMPISGALLHRPKFREILNRYINIAESQRIEQKQVTSDLDELSNIPLFLRLISEYTVSNIQIEKLLTHLRRHILLEDKIGSANHLPFICALALQGFNTEYTGAVTQKEQTELEALKQSVREKLKRGAAVDGISLCVLGCYEALHTAIAPHILSTADYPEEMHSLLTCQLIEPSEEREIKASIPDWTVSSNATSLAVRSQYEENPYPRWIHTNAPTRSRSVAACLQSPPLSMQLGDYKSPVSPDILVAGCGTGQHALQPAKRFTSAKVTAIDLSATSLAYAKRQCQKLGVSNIQFARADILELSQLKRKFDVIESVGVLHHMKDPMAGWTILTDLLRPGGLMKIGLYSDKARKDVIAGRKVVRELGFSTSPDNMRECRKVIVQRAAEGDPDLLQLARRNDFFSLSALRDLIFHVQEHRFDLLTVREYLTTLNLEFLDFEMPFSGKLQRFRDSISDRAPYERLKLWHDYEEQHPDTFRGMYQFWCRKPKTA